MGVVETHIVVRYLSYAHMYSIRMSELDWHRAQTFDLTAFAIDRFTGGQGLRTRAKVRQPTAQRGSSSLTPSRMHNIMSSRTG